MTSPETRPKWFDDLLVAHMGALKRRVSHLSMVGHDEIVSDTVAAALLQWDRFDPARGKFYTWLMLVARAAARDYRVRTERMWARYPLTQAAPCRPTPPNQEDAVYLSEVLSSVRPRHARFLSMAAGGWSHADIAAEDGSTSVAVATSIKYIRRVLRQREAA